VFPLFQKLHPRYIYPHFLELSLFNIQVISDLTEGILQWTCLNFKSNQLSCSSLENKMPTTYQSFPPFKARICSRVSLLLMIFCVCLTIQVSNLERKTLTEFVVEGPKNCKRDTLESGNPNLTIF
jgi:hypothetical protein